MEEDREFKSILRRVKLYAASSILGLFVLVFMTYKILPSIIEREPEENINTIVCVLAAVSIVIIVVNLRLPGMVTSWYRKDWDSMFKFWNLQGVLFWAIGCFAFILTAMGAVWQVTLPFLVVSALMSCTVFPTERRWKRLMGISNENQLFE